MSEKARGALFNALGDINGLTILDAFAGSGALCIEAMSRGAKTALAIDSDTSAARTLRQNILELDIDNDCHSVHQNVSKWSDNHPLEQFDLVFVDPPYDNLQLPLINKLTRHITSAGIMVVSWPGKSPTPSFSSYRVVAHKPLGDIQLVFYKKIG